MTSPLTCCRVKESAAGTDGEKVFFFFFFLRGAEQSVEVSGPSRGSRSLQLVEKHLDGEASSSSGRHACKEAASGVLM